MILIGAQMMDLVILTVPRFISILDLLRRFFIRAKNSTDRPTNILNPALTVIQLLVHGYLFKSYGIQSLYSQQKRNTLIGLCMI